MNMEVRSMNDGQNPKVRRGVLKGAFYGNKKTVIIAADVQTSKVTACRDGCVAEFEAKFGSLMREASRRSKSTNRKLKTNRDSSNDVKCRCEM